jgi:heme-degrading monooxygenase HmoA
MFTRVVEVQTKPGKARELSTTLNDKVLPILKKQPGFVDEITLVSNTDPDRILALSFWNSELDAQRYHNEQFTKINDLVKPVVETGPTVETFEVDISTIHKISKGKAA